MQGFKCSNACECPGSIIIYNCTAPGGLSTVWQGSAFHCAGNRISLLHTFHDFSTNVASCNNGAIDGKMVSVDVENSRYSSQLNVTVSLDLHNKTIECLYSNGTHLTHIQNFIIHIQSSKYADKLIIIIFVYLSF